MASLLPEQIPENWDAVTEAYEQTVTLLTGPCAADALRLAAVRSGERVLDVATGPGTFAVPAARTGAEVVAIDFSPAMIGRLRARIAAEGLANVTAAVMDGQALDLPDDSFDVAVSIFGMMAFPDRAKGFRELWRVLKPGGRAAVSGWGAPERMGPMVLINQALKRVMPDLPAPRERPLMFNFADPRGFEREMLEAGFRDVRMHTDTYSTESPSPERVSAGLMGVSPGTRALIERLGPAKRDELREAITDMLRQQFGNGPVRLSAEAHIAVGMK